jgi:predicted peptidase
MFLFVMALTFVTRSLVVDGVAHRYQVAVPARFEAGLPVILFLHGAGERGDDGLLQTTVGLPRLLRDGAVCVRAIVVMPQCPATSSWTGGGRVIALAALSAAVAEFRGDASRVALTGMSMGGAGALLLAAEHPDRFTRVLAVCPWVRTPPSLVGSHPDHGLSYDAVARRTASLPLWLIHGEADPLVPVSESRRLYAARPRESETCLTELKGVGHGAWDSAYGRSDVVEWLVRLLPPRR